MTNPDGRCAACGRYMGAALACPYCECEAAHARAMRAMRIGALALALCGLALLHAWSRLTPLPLLRAADLTPLMNHGAVRMAGAVERKPYVGRRDGEPDYVSFSIHDGSGVVRVQAHGRVAEDLARGPLPAAGDWVEAAGSLAVSAEGGARMRLRSARDLRLVPRALAADAADGEGGDAWR